MLALSIPSEHLLYEKLGFSYSMNGVEFTHFSRNGELLPLSDATVSLSNIEYQYGFGVYETVRVKEGIPYFIDEHITRLLESARIISLKHSFTAETVSRAVTQLVADIGGGTYNLKILLIGGEPQLNIVPLNPHFPDRKLYRDGVHCTTYVYERMFPHAKTLNMFRSYLAYSAARQVGAYDALLIDAGGNILEGTRTNFFAIKGKTLVSAPEEKILLGVTRKIVLKVADEKGYKVEHRDIPLNRLQEYDGAFLTSTSSGIMPIKGVDDVTFGPQPAALKELLTAFDALVDASGGVLK